MSDKDTIPDKTQERIAAELHRAFRHLHIIDGIPVTEILVVAHAEVMTQIACIFGGAAAAECAKGAAQRVASLPPVYATPADCVGVMQ